MAQRADACRSLRRTAFVTDDPTADRPDRRSPAGPSSADRGGPGRAGPAHSHRGHDVRVLWRGGHHNPSTSEHIMKSVVITGSSTGIGRACALTLDRNGFRVFAGVRKDADGDPLRAAASKSLT